MNLNTINKYAGAIGDTPHRMVFWLWAAIQCQSLLILAILGKIVNVLKLETDNGGKYRGQVIINCETVANYAEVAAVMIPQPWKDQREKLVFLMGQNNLKSGRLSKIPVNP